MNKNIISIVLIIMISITTVFSGCGRVGSVVNGSGNIVEKKIQAADFSDVDIAGPFTVEIIQSPTYDVALSTDENLLNRVLVSIDKGTLKFSIQAPGSFFPTGLQVKIGLPAIKNIVLTESVKASLSGFSQIDNLILIMKNNSSLNGYLEVNNTDFNISGRSSVSLKGKANRLQLDCLEESRVDLTDFVLSSANVRVTGASEAILNVNGRFDVLMEGASKIYYLGNPIFSNTSISGGSTMSRK
jgi:hypothetical protein